MVPFVKVRLEPGVKYILLRDGETKMWTLVHTTYQGVIGSSSYAVKVTLSCKGTRIEIPVKEFIEQNAAGKRATES